MDDELLGAHLRAIRASIIAVALALLATSVSTGSIGLLWMIFAPISIAFVLYAVAPSSFIPEIDR
jgi:hypothetical protein